MTTTDKLADDVTTRLSKRVRRCGMCKNDYPAVEMLWPEKDLYLCPRCYKAYMAHRKPEV